ncbi:hypothetical protein BH11BAC2_BH11BAC2_06710 [soil metagenome]
MKSHSRLFPNLSKLFILISIFLSFSGFSQQAVTYTVYGDSSNVYEISGLETQNGHLLTAIYDFLNGVDIVVVFRSDNGGMTWDSITTFGIDSAYHGYIDPYLTMDSVGTISLIAMRGVLQPGILYNGHNCWIQQSTDDGLTWNLHGFSPNIGSGSGTDFPRTSAWSVDQMLLTYQEIINSPPVIVACTSSDGGISWSNLISFPSVNGHWIGGSSIKKGFGSKAYVTYSDLNDKQLYFSESYNNGITWSLMDTIGHYNSLGYFYLTSIITNQNISGYGVLSHAAHHFENLYYYQKNSGTWSKTLIDSISGYAEGFMDSSGIIYVAYCKIGNQMVYLNYCYSIDGGITFTPPFTADSIQASVPITMSMIGDYSAIYKTSDGKIHISWVANYGDKVRAKHTIISNPVSIKELPISSDGINVSYHPSLQQILVKHPSSLQYSLILMDISGKVIKKRTAESGNQVINTNGLTSGIYIVTIREGNVETSAKVNIY